MTKTVTTGKATDLITFTRSTTGTYLDSVKYGDELVTNGTFDNNLDGWSGAGWVWSDGKAYDSGPTVTAGLIQTLTTVAGKYYALKFTLSNVSGGNPALRWRGQLITTYSEDVTDMVVILQATGTSTNFELIGGAATFYIDNVSVKEIIGNQGTSGEPLLRTADTNEPRIEYDADGNLKGLLIEEQRTNLVSDSEDMIVPFGRLTSESTTSPTGETTADSWKISDQTAGYWYNYAPINSGTTYTASVFVKLPTEANNAGLRYVRLQSQTTFPLTRAVFDLQTGTQTSADAGLVGSSITPCGNGWYRISITDTATSTTSGGSFSFVLFPAANSSGLTWTQTSDMVGKYLLHTFGWQTESGSFPTSYIPTSGSTVTRNADVASISTSKFEYNENASCVLIEASFLGRDSGEYPRLLDFAQGVNTSSIWATSTAVQIDKSGVGAQATVLWDMSPSKIAASVTSGDIALVVNDSTVDTSTATLVTTSTQFTIGASEGGSDRMSGHIKSIKYYPVRLTNNQLKALTQ